jgi:glycosyltransferase involved in cell wall biosynthesis
VIGGAAAPARPPVLHVVAAGEVGGAERMLVSLARGAAATSRRHMVALWTDDPAVRALFVENGIPVFGRPERPGPMVTPTLRALGGRDVIWLAELARALGAAALHLHTFASHVLGTRAARRAGIPVVRTEHSARVYDNWLCRPFSRWSLRRTATVVAVSDHLRRLISAREPALAGRLCVIRNGVSLPGGAPFPQREGAARLALVARLEPRKGVDRALHALARVPGPHLDVVGDGPLHPSLERLAAELGVADRVRFWGYRSDPEAVVADADAVICSSRSEGLGVALLEAMALGRPVVASPVGGVPEIVAHGETGWLAADMSIDSLAATLHAACASGRAEMARRGACARAAVQRQFTDAHMRHAYEEVYGALPPA